MIDPLTKKQIRKGDLNVIALTGEVCSSPLPRLTTSRAGKPMLTFVVKNQRPPDRPPKRAEVDGEVKFEPDFVPIVVEGDWAKALAAQLLPLKKSTRVFVEGRFESRNYTEKSTGRKRVSYHIAARDVRITAVGDETIIADQELSSLLKQVAQAEDQCTIDTDGDGHEPGTSH